MKHAIYLVRLALGANWWTPSGRPQIGFMVRRLPTPAALILEALLLNRLLAGESSKSPLSLPGLGRFLTFTVEQPAGAFFMVRRAVWEELGGFDEGFFPLWFEDVDFCRQNSRSRA